MAPHSPQFLTTDLLAGIPHDQVLRQTLKEMTEPAMEFFAALTRATLPPGTRFRVLQPDQLSQILGKDHTIADAVVLQDAPGLPEDAYYLFEGSAHASQEAVYQLAENVLRLGKWLKSKHPTFTLTPVLDVIDPGAVDPTIELKGLDGTGLSFKARVRRIAELDAEEYVKSDNPVAVMNVMNMTMAPERRVELCAQALHRLKRLLKPELLEKYGPYLLHCARFQAGERLELKERVKQLEPDMVESVMTALVKEGLAQGLVEGEAKGEAQAVLRILRRRKLRVSPAQRSAILACRDLPTVERWLDAAFDVRTTGELLAAP